MITAAVLAGGSGTRMGADIPKQFLSIGGKPLIIHTVERFAAEKRVGRIIVAVGQAYTEYMRELIARYLPGDGRITVISGGDTRSGTLVRVLEELSRDGISEQDIILTHDAVRPFIDGRIINENIDAAKEYGACNTCVPAVDTVFISADGRFADSVPDRSTVFHAQTPQSFCTKELYELCGRIPPDILSGLTDGCSVYTYFGKKVYMVRGSTDNIKITYPGDIKRAEYLLKGE